MKFSLLYGHRVLKTTRSDTDVLLNQSFSHIRSADGVEPNSAPRMLEPLVTAAYNDERAFTYLLTNEARQGMTAHRFAVGIEAGRAAGAPRVPRCTSQPLDITLKGTCLDEMVSWAAIPATVSDLWIERASGRTDSQVLFDDALADLSDITYALVIIARPIPLREFRQLRSRVLARRQEDVQRIRKRSDTDRVEDVEERLDVGRLDRWLAMLERGRNLGLWWVRLLVGAGEAAHVARVCGALAAAHATGTVILRAGHGDIARGNLLSVSVPSAATADAKAWEEVADPAILSSELLCGLAALRH